MKWLAILQMLFLLLGASSTALQRWQPVVPTVHAQGSVCAEGWAEIVGACASYPSPPDVHAVAIADRVVQTHLVSRDVRDEATESQRGVPISLLCEGETQTSERPLGDAEPASLPAQPLPLPAPRAVHGPPSTSLLHTAWALSERPWHATGARGPPSEAA